MNHRPLDGVRAKMARARHHLADLQAQCIEIATACDDAMLESFDRSTGQMVIAIGEVPRMPPAISLTLGDAVHNFRSALDHLAGALVTSMGALPRKDTTFPILRVAPTSGKSTRGLPNIAPGMAPDVRLALDVVQPYHYDVPDEHPLAMLHELDIRDKHRQLLVTLVGTQHVLTVGAGIEIDWFHGGPYADGDEVLRVRWDSWRNFSEPEPYFDVALGVVLREPGFPEIQMQRDPADLLTETVNAYIEREVIPLFEPFLPA